MSHRQTRLGFRRAAPRVAVQASPLKMLTPDDVGVLLKINPQTVKRLARAGHFIGAKKIGSAGWRIPETAVAAFIISEKQFISVLTKALKTGRDTLSV